MRSLTIQISTLIGIAFFLNDLWKNVAIEQTLVTGIGVGLSVYLVLTIGETLIRYILAQRPPADEAEEARVTSETVASDTTTQSPASA